MDLLRKKALRTLITLLICLSFQQTFASQLDDSGAVTTEGPFPQTTSIIILLPQIYNACLIGQPCPADAVWTGWQLPTLQVGQTLSFTTSSATPFYFGNNLNGLVNVTLTPFFQNQSSSNIVDELTANIANRSSIISTTQDGFSTFEASIGTDYYLLLGGLVRGGVTYQLQVSQVPLPAPFFLFGTGMTLLLSFKKRKLIDKNFTLSQVF